MSIEYDKFSGENIAKTYPNVIFDKKQFFFSIGDDKDNYAWDAVDGGE